ncbi:3-ketoacyl CoA thiolase 1, peroxisomal-like [Magnolia sinica]|uniref:3-ketoacyl CoA thiolase 1, peroxisomal-like n=1 Tax=Magnolia sinica TaxID=86752 RepID=UPI002658A2A4|nr:3-ketoacyl CoA thiolase 1, peroxisomal-like [Magnolia sinica]XP_058101879.1 3-ketoacyl CoA thiolase 1, peroxisomal-like [Magnolia sinica]XP_058101880.1 3-ketoacyl CoA thiolase 1, peroxisomal-like [Magnolia sinica]XP_058101881.1 3-ketoacyl CoA thiolase 1, peroxisomal-like [Magnolia sinica]XP_058101882.1 3-ketoacyl CoA thiolase 1, peroxisomal-like [Magnolia sinica]XP_058101883.1 3-ketoacyl CoA thiolase 1, peroxisomal-like [Magnolia sinica]XP_058101884.1 3-ketoacyl CoA thiolase 1, peroxisomal
MDIGTSLQDIDDKSGSERLVIVLADEGIQPDTSMLEPSFKDGGTATAGNSSQASDGAATVLLMKREVTLQRCLPMLGTFRYSILMTYERNHRIMNATNTKFPDVLIPYRWDP